MDSNQRTCSQAVPNGGVPPSSHSGPKWCSQRSILIQATVGSQVCGSPRPRPQPKSKEGATSIASCGIVFITCDSCKVPA